MRRVALSTLILALAFGFLATWIGPRAIHYYYMPPVPSGVASAFNCGDAVNWAMNRLIWTQIIGSGLGALFGLVIGILLARKRPAAPPPAAPVPPATVSAKR